MQIELNPTGTTTSIEPTVSTTTSSTGIAIFDKLPILFEKIVYFEIPHYSYLIHKLNLKLISDCDVRESEAIDGGWPGISKTECLANGMCWNNTWKRNWCHKPRSK